MAIKNYTTKVSVLQTVGEIQVILATHGARKVMMDYDPAGNVIAVTFGLEGVDEKIYGFRLEAKAHGVAAVMEREGKKCDPAQAERIAWRNIKDWIAAQVALVETEQASMAEVFFPKLIGKDQQTVYEAFHAGQPLLGAGDV